MRATWLRWAGLSLCYLAFAGSLSTAEAVAAALTGALAAALSVAVRERGGLHLCLRGRWGAVLAGEAAQMARDSARVAATLGRLVFLGRGHRGRVRLDRASATLAVGTGAGRRAAAALLASLTPDGVALGTRGEALPVHRLSRPSPAASPRRSVR